MASVPSGKGDENADKMGFLRTSMSIGNEEVGSPILLTSLLTAKT